MKTVEELRNPEGLKKIIEKVNDYWLKKIVRYGLCDWEHSAYLLGDIAAYEMTGKQEYMDYALGWAEENNWHFFDASKFGYDIRCADNQLCAVAYYKIMEHFPDKGTDEFILNSMKELLDEERYDYWEWIDLIYMGFPFYHIMSKRYNDNRYMEKVHKIYHNIRNERRLYDEEEHLWYRDESYLPEVRREENGEKIFWGRGNGWVFAGLARGLEEMGSECKYFNEYLKDYRAMAERLKEIMNEDGSFTVSFFDKKTYPYHETSSTALITLGYIIGVRCGFLEESYFDVAMKGFEWLTNNALEENGRIGWCQDIAGWPNHLVGKEISKDYAVGTYLLICKEFIRYVKS